MDVFVCLLSYPFLASSYIREVEKPLALAREKQRKTVIVPLFLNKMDERDIKDFKPFHPLPEFGKSLLCYENVRLAHKPIRTGLLDALEKVKSNRSLKSP